MPHLRHPVLVRARPTPVTKSRPPPPHAKREPQARVRTSLEGHGGPEAVVLRDDTVHQGGPVTVAEQEERLRVRDALPHRASTAERTSPASEAPPRGSSTRAAATMAPAPAMPRPR